MWEGCRQASYPHIHSLALRFFSGQAADFDRLKMVLKRSERAALFEVDAKFQECLGLRQGLELLAGRHHQPVWVALALFALGVGDGTNRQGRWKLT